MNEMDNDSSSAIGVKEISLPLRDDLVSFCQWFLLTVCILYFIFYILCLYLKGLHSSQVFTKSPSIITTQIRERSISSEKRFNSCRNSSCIWSCRNKHFSGIGFSLVNTVCFTNYTIFCKQDAAGHYSAMKLAQVQGYMKPSPKSKWVIVRDILNAVVLFAGAAYSLRYLYRYRFPLKNIFTNSH